MKRRDALITTARIIGGTVIGGELFLSGCRTVTSRELLSDVDIVLMDEIGDTILPETDKSPGAKAARIGAFMKNIVTDCYSEAEQAVFLSGLQEIEKLAGQGYGQGFIKMRSEDRLTLLTELDQKAKEYKDAEPAHYFTMLKQLSLWGYFSSETGVTQALRYNPIPGNFIGCIEYKGEAAWY